MVFRLIRTVHWMGWHVPLDILSYYLVAIFAAGKGFPGPPGLCCGFAFCMDYKNAIPRSSRRQDYWSQWCNAMGKSLVPLTVLLAASGGLIVRRKTEWKLIKFGVGTCTKCRTIRIIMTIEGIDDMSDGSVKMRACVQIMRPFTCLLATLSFI